MKKSKDSIVQALQQTLQQSHAHAQRLAESDFPLEAFLALQAWQRQRLANTYADIIALPDYAPAGRFFLEQLYGGLGFRERDQQVEKVLPVMQRLLPSKALQMIAEALELQVLSLQLDQAMTTVWIEQFQGLQNLNAHTYAQLYQRVGQDEKREKQIEMIKILGLDLAVLVKRPMLGHLLRVLKLPAHKAGFGALQQFLQQGFDAFCAMPDAEKFVRVIYQRERNLRAELAAGQATRLHRQSGG